MDMTLRFCRINIWAWLAWVLVCLLVIVWPLCGGNGADDLRPLQGVVTHDATSGPLVPWRPVRRSRRWLWRESLRRFRRVLAQARQRARLMRYLARLALQGALTLASVVDLLTQAQLRRYMGALPLLYSLLEALQVRQIINRHCPTLAEVDNGTVALVLILNRLVAPRPLSWVADWMARTVLVYTLGIPAAKFNDDRLGRTLEALSQHSREIWQDIVHHALVQADIDLSVIFYDLTAFAVHGDYAGSAHIDFGFAHNTPMDQRKFKTSLDVAADGNLPLAYKLWSGRTADISTVQENMERLRRLLERRGKPVSEVMVIGDRANLDDELAFAYDAHHLRYLAGLKAQGKTHREQLLAAPEAHFRAHPLGQERGRHGHWGIPCQLVFEHEGRQVTHKGLVMLSGPMRHALRQDRAKHLRALRQELAAVQAKIGRPWYRSVATVQQRADTVIRQSSVGRFMRAQAETDASGQVRLRWWIDCYTLWQAMQKDGRYLLATNDWSLSPQRMFDLYRQKDGVEKRFTVAKSDLKVSPLYLHKDERIEGMLLINMLALLTYSLLERQVRQKGLQLTTRRLIQKLETLDLIETVCWDGSRLQRLAPVDPEQTLILEALVQVLTDLRCPRWPHPLLPAGHHPLMALSPPPTWPVAA